MPHYLDHETESRLDLASETADFEDARRFMVEVLGHLPAPVPDAAASGLNVARAYLSGRATGEDLDAACVAAWNAVPGFSANQLTPAVGAVRSVICALSRDWATPREIYLSFFAEMALRAGVAAGHVAEASRHLHAALPNEVMERADDR